MSEEEKYEVLEKIGHGSFGVIRKVRRKSDGYVLCRKEISYVKMSQKEREQLQAELSILKELRHPNIVAYYEREHIKATQDLHLYMEYCGNGDLGQVIKKLKLKNQYAEEDFVWSIFAQLVTALYRCHYGEDAPDVGRNIMGLGNNAKPLKSKQGHYMILHRDLKPENVFLGTDNSVKLGDFGLSKILQSHDFASTYVGTPFYMSPEICASERYTLHSDIWSLGCIIYELCAREPPFNARTHFELIQKIRAGRVPSLPSIYSPDLQKIVNSCLQTNPNLRPDTVQLLNLPIIKLMRKEQEVVRLGQQMKVEKDRAAKAVKELNDRVTYQEADRNKMRKEINAELQADWEYKARAEIDRQVEIEITRLREAFEGEVQQRLSAELKQRSPSLMTNSVQTSEGSTPPLALGDLDSSNGTNLRERGGKSESTNFTASEFPSQTDISSLSFDSSSGSIGRQTKALRPRMRTPMTRAKTMVVEAVTSPVDITMASPSPAKTAPIAALSLSPRRRRNLFSAVRDNPTNKPTLGELKEKSEYDDADVDTDDENALAVPALPSPIRPKSAGTDDPFKVLQDGKPRLAPSQHRLASAPNLFGGMKPGLQVRAQGGVPVVATSPNRKARPINGVISPVRRGNPQRDSETSSVPLRSKKGASDDIRVQAMRNQLHGRTLVELAQARTGGIPNSVSDSEEVIMKRASRDPIYSEKVAEWDPEVDEMPSPFLVRTKGLRAAGIR